MADNKKKNSFFSTKQTTESSNSSDITAQVRSAIDMSVLSLLNSMAKDLSAIMKKVTGQTSSAKDKEDKIAKEKEDKNKKPVTEDEIKQAKKVAKQREKSQKKVNQKLTKQEKKEKKKEERKEKFGDLFKGIGKALKGSFSKSFSEAMNLNNGTASKILSANSMVVNKSLRDLQVGMGLDSNQAMALSGAMTKMNIDKEDLAYLTEGQRGLLSELTGTMEKAYAGTDMNAISEMGNSLFKIQALFGVFQDILVLKLQEVLTVLQPVLDMVEVLLGQLIDSVLVIFESPTFKNLILMLGAIVGAIVQQLMPILQVALGAILDIIFNLMVMLEPLIVELMPVLMLFVNVIIALLVPLMPIIAMAIDFIMQLLDILVPIIVALLPILVVVIQTIGMILEMIMPILIPIIQIIGKVIEATLPLIYIVIAVIYNIIVAIYNTLNLWGKDKEYMSLTLDVDTKSSFVMPKIENTVSMSDSKDPVANSYSGGNNVSSVKNDTKNITVDASFNSNISGDASKYSQELQKSNYQSSTLLSSIIEENS